MKYFKNVKDLQELKKEYYKLALKHHPDRGGDTATMQMINNEYEKLSFQLINGNTDFSEGRKTYETKASSDLQEKINLIINFENLIIEIIGSWLWVSGETYTLRNDLKQAGFKFSRNKTAWYYHAGEYRKKSRKSHSMGQIRKMWGAQTVEQDKKQKIA